MSTKKDTQEALPGVSYERFRKAVTALVKLRDSGEFLLLLGRENSVRPVGALEDFCRGYAAELSEDSVEREEAAEVLTEIRRFLAAWAAIRNTNEMLSALERGVFEEAFGKLSPQGQKRLREQLEAKTKLVSARLFTPAMAARVTRMQTAVGPCLEDVDVELVSRRKDEIEDQEVTAPFLRVRLRYTEGTGNDLLVRMFRPSWPFGSSAGSKSFEFECDETDIDLLQRRLQAAKDLLLQAMEEVPSG